MSKKTVPTVCLVVDTSIARSAGPPATKDDRGRACRDFLVAMRGAGHRMAINAAISAEWVKHMSGFSIQWLASMVSLRKVQPVPDSVDETFRNAIAEHVGEEGVRNAIMKDAFLVEAALASDEQIASLDDRMRGHLARLSAHHPAIKTILWVNPEIEAEGVIEWLESGAPNQPRRQLGRHKPDAR